jgi:hypothetical protein
MHSGKYLMRKVGILIILLVSTSALANYGSWNNPYKLNPKFNPILKELPIVGELKDKSVAWPGNHWANNLGSIAHRWSSINPNDFNYKSPTQHAAMSMEPHLLEELSPAEKYDLFNGWYHYPTKNMVWGHTSPHENWWNGICHGFAPASVHYPEPKTKVLLNPDGIPVTFYSSDIKALLSYFYARFANSRVLQVGKRCYGEPGTRRGNRSGCFDLNAGAFHIIMANRLGLEGKSFLADASRFSEVWNHAAIGFESYFVDEDPRELPLSEIAGKKFRIQTGLTFAGTIAPKTHAVIGTDDAQYFTDYYDYYVQLDDKGRIIDGEWISEIFPDFIWEKDKASFYGRWKALEKLLD